MQKSGYHLRPKRSRGVWASAFAGATNRLALAFGPADGACGHHGVDFALRVAELAQHFRGVPAEFRRRPAQARLGPLQSDRGGDALVPILLNDIAAMPRMLAGQRR